MTTNVSFTVPGMTCGHCTSAVESELSKVPGVTSVQVDLDTKTVVLATAADAVDWSVLEAAVDEAGFELVR